MLQCGSNDEVIKGNLCSMNCENGNRSTSKNINVVKLHNLLYMMKIVIKLDAGMHGAAFFALGRGGAEGKIFGAGQGENARGGAG